jgi:hypothetical protein
MSRNRSKAAAAAFILALLASGAVWAQANRSSIPAENEAAARQAAVDNAARPLLEAARSKPYLGHWRIASPQTLTTADGKAPLNGAGRAAYRKVARARQAKTPIRWISACPLERRVPCSSTSRS